MNIFTFLANLTLATNFNHSSSNQPSMKKNTDLIYPCNSEGIPTNSPPNAVKFKKTNICKGTDYECPARNPDLKYIFHDVCIVLNKNRNPNLNIADGYNRFLVLSKCEPKDPDYINNLSDYMLLKVIDCRSRKKGEKQGENCDIKLNRECDSTLELSPSTLEILQVEINRLFKIISENPFTILSGPIIVIAGILMLDHQYPSPFVLG